MIQIAYMNKCPTIFTAHDYYLICPQTKLLTNNLALCTGPGDGFKCGRCYPCAVHDRKIYPNLAGYNAPIRFIFSYFLGLYCSFYKERNFMIKRYVNYLTSLVSPSNYLLSKLNRNGITTKNDKVIPNGVKPPFLLNSEDKISNDINFIFMGGSAKNKGASLMINAFSKITAGAKLYIYGKFGATQKIFTQKEKCQMSLPSYF